MINLRRGRVWAVAAPRNAVSVPEGDAVEREGKGRQAQERAERKGSQAEEAE
jgi:hypothetical protein